MALGRDMELYVLVMLLFAGAAVVAATSISGDSGGNPGAPTAQANADDTVPVGSPVN
jgi:hypothetical protein